MNSIPIDYKNLAVAMLIARVLEEARTADTETEDKRSGFVTPWQHKPAKSLTSSIRCEIKEIKELAPFEEERYSTLQNERILYELEDREGMTPCWETFSSFFPGGLACWKVLGRLIHEQGTTEWAQVTPELAIKRMINFAFHYNWTDHTSEYEDEIASAQIIVAKFLTHLAILSKDVYRTNDLSVYHICGASMRGYYDHNYQKLLPCGILAQVAISGKIFNKQAGEDFEYSLL